MILSLLAEPGPASACDIWTKSNLGKAALSETNAAYRARARRESNRSRGRCNRSETSLFRAGAELLDRSSNEVLRRWKDFPNRAAIRK